MPQLPIEIWKIIVDYYTPTREDYAVTLPWKRSVRDSTLVSLTQVCSEMRKIALPLVWAIVYVETMKDWGLLWKRISRQSGQHVHTFINFWAIARLPPYCMDHLKERGKDLLWYAFIDRKNNPLCDLVTGHKNIRYNPYEKLGNGPDGHGPDVIIQSRAMFLQACKEISSTWSKRLDTLYWYASTTFPECVILNIRIIQESDGNVETDFPGLEHLCIDYFERTTEEEMNQYRSYHPGSTSYYEHARRMTFFNEPIWKLGPTTLEKLKFFSLAPPFWPNISTPIDNLARKSPSRLQWGEDAFETTGQLDRQLKDYAENTGPAQYHKILRSIRPEIFFSTSQSPIHCQDLLPCWARLRCIHIFGLVVMTNDKDTKELEFPKDSQFFQTQKIPDASIWSLYDPDQDMAGKYLRGAIQLRPALEQLSKRLGGRVLSGEDIISYATTVRRLDEKESLKWTEDWKYALESDLEIDLSTASVQSKDTKDLFSVYKEWLKDPQMAEKVAQAYNEGVRDHQKVPYPFQHSQSAGRVYFDTSQCKIKDDKVWLDRPRHRGCYSTINLEEYPKRPYERPCDSETIHPQLSRYLSYQASM